MPETEEIKKQRLEELQSRKKVELIEKNQALKTEIDEWKSASERSQAFEKHFSQIRAIQEYLHGWNGKVEEKLNRYAEESNIESFLKNCANAERLILSEHRLWDYFRSKFIQRKDDIFNLYLRAADEFAWACYEPVQKAAYPKPTDNRRKEPPLVFFNGGFSPFSLSRNRAFQPETVAGEPLQIDPKAFANLLPIPVVGIPWQQISHLPDALVVGHEVGHIVEADFDLTERLEQILSEALEEADESRQEAWKKWLGEIFADIYGCLAGGAAYAGTLIDFLAKTNARISNEAKTAADWGDYPTDYLRVKLILKTIEQLGFAEEIKSYNALWENYGSAMPAAFLEDIDKIVSALLDGKHENLGGYSIKEVFCFSKTQQEKAVKASLEMPKRTVSANNLSTDIRVLFAALRLAFERNPELYKEKKIGEKVLTHIRFNVIKGGVRAAQIKPDLSAAKNAGADLAEKYFEFIENSDD